MCSNVDSWGVKSYFFLGGGEKSSLGREIKAYKEKEGEKEVKLK